MRVEFGIMDLTEDEVAALDTYKQRLRRGWLPEAKCIAQNWRGVTVRHLIESPRPLRYTDTLILMRHSHFYIQWPRGALTLLALSLIAL